MNIESSFWDDLYKNQQTQWDAKTITTPIKQYIDQLQNRELKILIPGCGNAHEAQYLIEKGFENITLLDYSWILVKKLKEKFKNYPEIKILHENFFEHQNTYDLILEQTFLSALHPTQREDYAKKIKQLLKPKGRLVGVLFGIDFDKNHPPFGGSAKEYKLLFQDKFLIHTLEQSYNSIKPRAGTEIFVNLQNNS